MENYSTRALSLNSLIVGHSAAYKTNNEEIDIKEKLENKKIKSKLHRGLIYMKNEARNGFRNLDTESQFSILEQRASQIKECMQKGCFDSTQFNETYLRAMIIVKNIYSPHMVNFQNKKYSLIYERIFTNVPEKFNRNRVSIKKLRKDRLNMLFSK